MYSEKVDYNELLRYQFLHMSNKQLVTFLNGAYQLEIPLDPKFKKYAFIESEPVEFVWLDARSDNHKFNLKSESFDDGSFALLMLGQQVINEDYDACVEEISILTPRIFYFRVVDNVTETHTVHYEHPRTKEDISFPASVSQMSEYTFKQLADERLTLFLQFYPLKYWTPFGGENELEQFLADVRDMASVLEDLLEKGLIDSIQMAQIILNFTDIAEQTIHNTSIQPLKDNEQALEAIVALRVGNK